MARFVSILLFLEGLTEIKALGWTCITSELPFFDPLHGMLCRISKEPAINTERFLSLLAYLFFRRPFVLIF